MVALDQDASVFDLRGGMPVPDVPCDPVQGLARYFQQRFGGGDDFDFGILGGDEGSAMIERRCLGQVDQQMRDRGEGEDFAREEPVLVGELLMVGGGLVQVGVVVLRRKHHDRFSWAVARINSALTIGPHSAQHELSPIHR